MDDQRPPTNDESVQAPAEGRAAKGTDVRAVRRTRRRAAQASGQAAVCVASAQPALATRTRRGKPVDADHPARRPLPPYLVPPTVLPPEPPDAAALSYVMLRALGGALDELSSQGLELWQDTAGRWRWSWRGSVCHATRGFWAIGEAVVDAVTQRFPHAFRPAE